MNKFKPNTQIIGKKSLFLPTCHSTNDEAQQIIQKNENFHGTVIMADFQENGRGQRGNSWESLAGQNLLFSLAIDTSFLNVSQQFYLSKITSLAVYDAVQSLGFSEISIKWPNDILIDKKKIGGILIENNISGKNLKSSVIGIGINVWQENLVNGTSLVLINKIICPSILNLAEKICEFFENYFIKLKESKDFEIINQLYFNRLLGYQEILSFRVKHETFNAKIINVEESGLLMLDIGGIHKLFDIKEISFEL